MKKVKMMCVFCELWALRVVRVNRDFRPNSFCSTFLRLSDRRVKPLECSNSNYLWHTAENIRRPRLRIRISKLGDFAWSPNKDSEFRHNPCCTGGLRNDSLLTFSFSSNPKVGFGQVSDKKFTTKRCTCSTYAPITYISFQMAQAQACTHEIKKTSFLCFPIKLL